MKRALLSVFIVASLMVTIAHCFPRAPFQDDSNEENFDTVLVLPNRNSFLLPRPMAKVPAIPTFDDDDRFKNFDPFRSNPFDGFLSGFQGFMNRIHEQMAGVLSSLPGQDIFSFGGKIPEGANTTSTTKIIDGHIVVTNDTIYENPNDSNFVFRLHVVDIKPLNATNEGNGETEIDVGGGEEIDTENTQTKETPNKQDGSEITTKEPRSVETVEDETANEISNKDQVENLNA